ncbi:MAG: hypothetical protein ACXVC6_01900 [Bacteroidia bacterium]
MRLPVKKYLLFLFLSPLLISAQDSLYKYRVTSFHASVSHFMLVGPQYPQTTSFFPTAMLSLKSASCDSNYHQLDKKNFMITVGVASSRFMFKDDQYFINFLNKSPMLIFSRRFWGGFGINYRKEISEKLILDLDVAPIVQIIIDKSVETRTDTASWESKGYEDIYQGLHVYANAKLEFRSNDNYAVYFAISASVPVLNRFVDNDDEKYRDQFKGQLFAGVGMRYFYKSKRKVEANKPRVK